VCHMLVVRLALSATVLRISVSLVVLTVVYAAR